MHWRAAALILAGRTAVSAAGTDGFGLADRALTEDDLGTVGVDALVQWLQHQPSPVRPRFAAATP